MQNAVQVDWLWRAFRRLMPLIILAVSGIVLWPQINTLDVVQLKSHWSAITAIQWVAAGAFTILSFWSIGQYDVIAHRQLNTGLPAAQAHSSGMTAIALSQTLGFGVVTATLARWRMLRGFGPGVAASVTGIVSLSFMIMLIGLTAFLSLILPTPAGVNPFAVGVLLLTAGVCVLALRFPHIHIRGRRIELPSLRAMGAAGGWAYLDVALACLALWFLIPAPVRPDFLSFLPAFCLALSAGLFSGTPGGAGPFEIVLFALTASGAPAAVPADSLLVAIFGFRLVYFAIPAILASVRLVVRPAPLAIWRDPLPPSVNKAPRAESCVVQQNGGYVQQVGNSFAAIWPTGQALVAMFDPFDRPEIGFFQHLRMQAKEQNKFALIYKSNALTATRARASGWHVLHTADDAILDLSDYHLATPERASLRRKLRKATREGVYVRQMSAADTAQMAEIDADWQKTSGQARGGTMGRFCPQYLRGQSVFVAEHSGKIVAFASFHISAREWTLDIMRQTQHAPDGTMHSLVQTAINAAQAAMIPQMSLAAVPACADPNSALWRAIAIRVVEHSRSAGLRQFKSSFAPRWKPLYIGAPSRMAFVVGVADILREVFAPAPISTSSPEILNALHQKDENYEVASKAAA